MEIFLRAAEQKRGDQYDSFDGDVATMAPPPYSSWISRGVTVAKRVGSRVYIGLLLRRAIR